ncbi:MAG TPA: metallophosphoesterase [Ornithinibacter sp.]|nr:metallophosphoesterase [Ornithinibacter sp.]
MTEHTLGEQLTGPYAAGGGTATTHRGGVVLQAPGVRLTAWFDLPSVGRPGIVSGDPAVAPFGEVEVEATGDGWSVATLPAVVGSALSGRLALAPVGGDGPVVDVVVGPAVSDAAAPEGVRLPLHAPQLPERVLHDVVVRDDTGGLVPVAPHAVYHRRSWSDFGLAHVTDTHVARRIDSFRRLLTEAGRAAAAAGLVNWNDRFRGFVRFANQLHGQGVLDVVIVTGDCYDYIHEDDDDPAGGGNAEFLRQLVLGQAPGPDFPDVEPLRVPIFLTPGNHDYRKHAYTLVFDLHVSVGPLGKDVARVTHFGSYGIRKQDAVALTNRLDPGWLAEAAGNPSLGDQSVRNLSSSAGAAMVEIDREMSEYRRFLGEPGTYVVELGDHRLVMVDSGPDTGVIDSLGEGIAFHLGLFGEDEATFVGGSPNCTGPSAADVREVERILDSAPDHALVIVGTHAPLLNLWQDEYPFFLRETQRRHHARQVESFLVRHSPLAGTGLGADKLRALARAAHPSWFGPGGSDDLDFVKRGDNADLLDHGVSRGGAERLLAAFAGVGVRRPGDLVLAGHTHRDNEFVVRRLADGEPAFFLDFYTANPANYYPSVFADGDLDEDVSTSTAWVTVQPGADPAGLPTRTVGLDLEHEVGIPPYADPLNDSADPAAWWSTHRPLVLQTGALGPLKVPRIFGGFRVVEVRENVIRRVDRVPVDRLAEHGFVLDWDAARAPLPALLPPAAPWLSVSEGSTAPGGTVTAVGTLNEVDLFLADPGGGVYTVIGKPGRWGPWRSVAEGASTPGGAVTPVRGDDGKVSLFLTDPGGGIYTIRGRGDTWGSWTGVSQGTTTPGATVSAAAMPDGRIVLAVANATGAVFACHGHGTTWGPWSNVSEGSSTPGATVSVVAGDDGRVSLFLADPGGGVYTARGIDDEWSTWTSVSQGSTTPGGTVTAVPDGDRIALFLADPGGGVYTARGDRTTWSTWTSVSDGATVPGGVVSVVPVDDGFAVLLVDRAGGVYLTTGRGTGWGPWATVAEGVSTPGARVGAATWVKPFPPEQRRVLVIADPAGAVYAKGLPL